MGEFYEKLPDYIEKREDKESLKWIGKDSSFEIFPHLNIDWKQIKEIYDKSKKPIGDLGSCFSTLPVEGELRGIDIIPIDIMHAAGRDRYEGIMEKNFTFGVVNRVYERSHRYTQRLPEKIQETMGIDKPLGDYWEEVDAAIQKVMSRYIVADLAHIPLKDRSLSVAIVHDTLPKHSADLKTFLEKQLPEILRVTDQVAYVYPMSIYKTIIWWEKYDPEYKDPDTGEPYYWKKLSEWTPGEIKEEKVYRQMSPEEGPTPKKRTMEESHPLYKDPESIKAIAEAAEKLGLEFRLERGSEPEKEKYKKRDFEPSDPFTRYEQEEAMLGIFVRKTELRSE